MFVIDADSSWSENSSRYVSSTAFAFRRPLVQASTNAESGVLIVKKDRE